MASLIYSTKLNEFMESGQISPPPNDEKKMCGSKMYYFKGPDSKLALENFVCLFVFSRAVLNILERYISE